MARRGKSQRDDTVGQRLSHDVPSHGKGVGPAHVIEHGRKRQKWSKYHGVNNAPSPILKCKFCEWVTPEWTRTVDTYRGVAFKAGWPGLHAHVANVHPKEYAKIRKGLQAFDQDKAWALRS